MAVGQFKTLKVFFFASASAFLLLSIETIGFPSGNPLISLKMFVFLKGKPIFPRRVNKIADALTKKIGFEVSDRRQPPRKTLKLVFFIVFG